MTIKDLIGRVFYHNFGYSSNGYFNIVLDLAPGSEGFLVMNGKDTSDESLTFSLHGKDYYNEGWSIDKPPAR